MSMSKRQILENNNNNKNKQTKPKKLLCWLITTFIFIPIRKCFCACVKHYSQCDAFLTKIQLKNVSNGVCVPQGCDDRTTDIAIESRQFTTHLFVEQQTYLLPFDPDNSNLNRTRVRLNPREIAAPDYTVDKGPSNTAIVFKPTTWQASRNGPIHLGEYAGRGGSCTTATISSGNSYFQFYQTQRLFCYTNESTVSSPQDNSIYTFYPVDISTSDIERYCFVGARLTVSSRVTSGLRVVAISELSNEKSSLTVPMNNTIFYGRREVIPEETSEGDYNVCMEYKCGGEITKVNPYMEIGNAYTKVTIDIKDFNSSVTCNISINEDIVDVMEAGLNMCDGDPFESGTPYETPLCFIDPQR